MFTRDPRRDPRRDSLREVDQFGEGKARPVLTGHGQGASVNRVLDAYLYYDRRSPKDVLTQESELLMKKLVEVEMDGQAAAKQTAALKDYLRRLREVRYSISAGTCFTEPT